MMHRGPVPARLVLAALATLLLAAGAAPAGAATAPPTATTAAPSGGSNDGVERRINRFRGRGLRACRVARRRVGGGRCTRVTETVGARERYEARILRGAFRYDVHLSRLYRVLEVERERIDDDATGDDNGGGNEPGDDNGGDRGGNGRDD
jgi:hypothetical protein